MDGPGALLSGEWRNWLLFRGEDALVIKAKTVDAMQFNSKPRQQKEGKDRMNKELPNIQDTHRHEELAQQCNFCSRNFPPGSRQGEIRCLAIQKQNLALNVRTVSLLPEIELACFQNKLASSMSVVEAQAPGASANAEAKLELVSSLLSTRNSSNVDAVCYEGLPLLTLCAAWNVPDAAYHLLSRMKPT
jgi:hypothetical protein